MLDLIRSDPIRSGSFFAFFFLGQVGRNICHGSDSVENAEKEIALWFGESEVVDHESAMKDWIYE